MDLNKRFKVVNRATGSSFEALPGETVLAAAQRNEVALTYSCLQGTCGICHGKVISGSVIYPYQPPLGLDLCPEPDQTLFCQAVPTSDLIIAAREPRALRNLRRRQLDVTVTELRLLAPDVALVRLAVPAPGIQYLGGQYLDFVLPDGRRRAFSIASAPEASGDLELHVRSVPGGNFTDEIFHRTEVGRTFRVEIPLGAFYLRDRSRRPMIFVAGGTGFAPIKAIIEHAIAINDTREKVLYWGARVEADLYMDALAREWAQEHASIRYVPVLSDQQWNGRQGFVHQAVVEDFPDLKAYDMYMSGPPALIDAGREAFHRAGLPDNHLYYDSFEFAPDLAAKQKPQIPLGIQLVDKPGGVRP